MRASPSTKIFLAMALKAAFQAADIGNVTSRMSLVSWRHRWLAWREEPWELLALGDQTRAYRAFFVLFELVAIGITVGLVTQFPLTRAGDAPTFIVACVVMAVLALRPTSRDDETALDAD